MELREVVLDTETTGLDPRDGHRVVEIGLLEMRNKVLTGRKFHHYLNPERSMPTEAYRIHGISGEFLKDKPRFIEIADEFLDFVNGAKLVIHNAVFDIKFLNHELSLLKKPLLDIGNAIDTLAMARKMFPGMKTNLDALCKRFGIDNSGRKFHGALKDAALLAEVYVELEGGRQVSFNITSGKEISVHKLASSKCDAVNNKNIVVIKPTKEELAKHKDFLSKISNPIWAS